MDTSLISQLISDVQPEYWYGAVFLGTFLLGENVIIAAFVFAASRSVAFPGTVLAALLGTIIADIFWYMIATHIISRTRLQSILQKKNMNSYLNPILETIDKHPYVILLIIKFLVGIRILLSISVVTRLKIPFKQFLFFDSLGAAFFIAILGLVGWLAGTEILSVSSTHTIFTTTLFTIVIISLSLHLISRILIGFLKKFQKEKTA